MNWQPREDERVARALDGARSPADQRVAGLVAVAERVREVGRNPRLKAAPDFRAELRARLLAEAPTLLPRPRVPADAPEVGGAPGGGRHAAGPRRRRADGVRPNRPAGTGPVTRTGRPGQPGRRRLVAATVLAAVAFSGSTVVASSGALPGDPLYGLKRRVQGVEVALARGDEDRGRRHLELARTRVRELGTVAASGSAGPLVATLDDMDVQTRDGVRLLSTVALRGTDEAPLVELAGWVTEQRSLLAAASGALPGPVRDRAAGSLDLLRAAADRVAALRGSLACACPVTPADDLGPLPCPGCSASSAPTSGATDPREVRPPAGGSGAARPSPRPTEPASTGGRSAPAPAPSGSPAPSSPPTRSDPTLDPTGGQLPGLPLPSASPPPSAPAPRLPLPTGPIVPSVITGVVGLFHAVLGGPAPGN